MPDVRRGEAESAYVERCIPVVLREGTAKSSDQAVAICHSMWTDHHKKMASAGELAWPVLPELATVLAEWREEDHPRDAQGKFTDAYGAGSREPGSKEGGTSGVLPITKSMKDAMAAAKAAQRPLGKTEIYDKLSASEKAKIEGLRERARKLAPEYDALQQRVAAELGYKLGQGDPSKWGDSGPEAGTYFPGPLKGAARIAEKSIQEDSGRLDDIKDVLRGTFVVNTPEEANRVLDAYRRLGQVTKDKDRFLNPADGGYRNILLQVQLSDGMRAEVQIDLPELLWAKEIGPGHKFYENMRVSEKGSDFYELNRRSSEKLYGEAWVHNILPRLGPQWAFLRSAGAGAVLPAVGGQPELDGQDLRLLEGDLLGVRHPGLGVHGTDVLPARRLQDLIGGDVASAAGLTPQGLVQALRVVDGNGGDGARLGHGTSPLDHDNPAGGEEISDQQVADFLALCEAATSEPATGLRTASSRYLASTGVANGAKVQRRRYKGREHLVVPVVALIGGAVVRPLNSSGPEYVPASELANAPEGWNGRPVVPDHPDGGRSSANLPHLLEDYAFGRLFNTRFHDGRLKTEAWIDPEKAQRIGGDAQEVVKRILAGQMVEVSVGCYVNADRNPGVTAAGQAYEYTWSRIVPDHLAVGLKGGKGACSIEMGCGAPRAASSLENIRKAGQRSELRGARAQEVEPAISARGLFNPNHAPAGTPEGGQFSSIAQSIAKSYDEAAREHAAHIAKLGATLAQVPLGTKAKLGRREFTRTDVAGDIFWLPERGSGAFSDRQMAVELGAGRVDALVQKFRAAYSPDQPRDERGRWEDANSSDVLAAVAAGLPKAETWGSTQFLMPDGTGLGVFEETHSEGLENLPTGAISLGKALTSGLVRVTHGVGVEAASPITMTQAKLIADHMIYEVQDRSIKVDVFKGRERWTHIFDEGRATPAAIRNWINSHFSEPRAAGEWDESQHPREPAGSPEGGQFAGSDAGDYAARGPAYDVHPKASADLAKAIGRRSAVVEDHPNAIRAAGEIAAVAAELRAAGHAMPNELRVIAAEGNAHGIVTADRGYRMTIQAPRELPPEISLDQAVAAAFGTTKDEASKFKWNEKYAFRTFKDIFVHEVGHVNDPNLSTLQTGGRRSWMDRTGRAEGPARDIAFKVSKRAGDSPDEFVAETFVRLWRGETLPADVQKMYDRMLVKQKNPSRRAAAAAEDLDVCGIEWPDWSAEEWRRRVSLLRSAGDWDESKHPRVPSGTPEGGEFTSSDGSSAGGSKSPVKVATVEEAIPLILAGKYVEFTDVRQVHTVISRLADIALEAKAKGEDAPKYNLCQVSVAGTNLFCADNLGAARINMPQFGGYPTPGTPSWDMPRRPENPEKIDVADAFVEHLAGMGITHERDTVPASFLRATQRELVGAEVARMMLDSTYNPRKDPVFISRDNYVLDGHHRWAAIVGRDAEDGVLGQGRESMMDVRRLDAPMVELLRIAQDWTKNLGIKIKKGLRGAEWDESKHPRDEQGQWTSGDTVYHGSTKDFEKFDVGKVGTTTDDGWLGKGLYFSTDKKMASYFPLLYEASVRLSNPLRLEMPPGFGADKRDLVREALGLEKTATSSAVTDTLRARGHDGVVLDYSKSGYKHFEIMVMDNESIDLKGKSETGDTHMWDERAFGRPEKYRYAASMTSATIEHVLISSLAVRALFDPDQPSDDIGRWTDSGGGSQKTDQQVLDATENVLEWAPHATDEERGWRKNEIADTITEGLLKNHKDAVRNLKPNEVKQLCARALDAWATSSGGANGPSCAMQLAAQEEFGLKDATTEALGGKVRGEQMLNDSIEHWGDLQLEGDPDQYPTGREFLRGYLRAQYEFTQALLGSEGVDEVVLFRGAHYDEGVEYGDSIFKLQPISSFSSNPDVAIEFSGGAENSYLHAVRVPADRVLSTALTGYGCLPESEFTLLGGEYRGLTYNAWDTFHEDLKEQLDQDLRQHTLPKAAAAGKVIELDEELANADWPKRTPDEFEDLTPEWAGRSLFDPNEPRDERGRWTDEGGVIERGSVMGTVYHGGKTKISQIDKSRLQSRDYGYYGSGFYVAETPGATKGYGRVVSAFEISPEASVLRVPMRPSDASDQLRKAVRDTLTQDGLAKAEARGKGKEFLAELDLMDTSPISWKDAVDRFAQIQKIDVVRYGAGEVVVRNTDVLRPVSRKRNLFDPTMPKALAEFDESQHPRVPAGSPEGGEFAPAGGAHEFKDIGSGRLMLEHYAGAQRFIGSRHGDKFQAEMLAAHYDRAVNGLRPAFAKAAEGVHAVDGDFGGEQFYAAYEPITDEVWIGDNFGSQSEREQIKILQHELGHRLATYVDPQLYTQFTKTSGIDVLGALDRIAPGQASHYRQDLWQHELFAESFAWYHSRPKMLERVAPELTKFWTEAEAAALRKAA